MNFNEKYNTDDVFIRSMLLGLIKNLSDHITYFQIDPKQNKVEIFIPFFIATSSGDESFLQDNFVDLINCEDNSTYAEGNYDVVPRGAVKLTSLNINTESLTNKFVRGSYDIEDKTGQIKGMSAYINPIPFICDVEVRIKCDTYLDSFKILESVISTFYSVFSYYFEYMSIPIPVQATLPQTYANTKLFDFTYMNTPPIELQFNLSLETYFPQKDLSTERFKGNLMQKGIRTDLKIKSKTNITENFGTSGVSEK